MGGPRRHVTLPRDTQPVNTRLTCKPPAPSPTLHTLLWIGVLYFSTTARLTSHDWEERFQMTDDSLMLFESEHNHQSFWSAAPCCSGSCSFPPCSGPGEHSVILCLPPSPETFKSASKHSQKVMESWAQQSSFPGFCLINSLLACLCRSPPRPICILMENFRRWRAWTYRKTILR